MFYLYPKLQQPRGVYRLCSYVRQFFEVNFGHFGHFKDVDLRETQKSKKINPNKIGNKNLKKKIKAKTGIEIETKI